MDLQRPKELEAILASIADPDQREIVARAFEKICQGDLHSFPVTYAIAMLAVSQSVRDTVHLTGGTLNEVLVQAQTIAEEGRTAVSRQTEVCGGIEKAALQIQELARRIHRIKWGWIGTVILSAFVLGVVLGSLLHR